jgi:hypothetical protein
MSRGSSRLLRKYPWHFHEFSLSQQRHRSLPEERVPEAKEGEAAGARGTIMPEIVQWNADDHHLLFHEMVMRVAPGALNGRE